MSVIFSSTCFRISRNIFCENIYITEYSNKDIRHKSALLYLIKFNLGVCSLVMNVIENFNSLHLLYSGLHQSTDSPKLARSQASWTRL